MLTAVQSSVGSLRGGASHLADELRPGAVYRREDLARLSFGGGSASARGGGYRKAEEAGPRPVPRTETVQLWSTPPADEQVVGGFLRDKDFLVFSPSAYNAVGLCTTQLYNRTLVYNHKRHGVFKLGNRQFDFRMKPRFPRKLTPEFLYVDLLNNLNNLDEPAEDRDAVLRQARSKLLSFDSTRLQRAVDSFGSEVTRKRLREWAGG